jgi:hypothetical protein
MFSTPLLLVLALGQTPAPAEAGAEGTIYVPPPATPSEADSKRSLFPPTYPNAPTPLGDFVGPSFGPSEPDRFFLMKALQGTILGDLLDSNRTQFTGWVETAYTASSVRRDNTPSLFDSRANELSLPQNYLRLERSVDTGRKEFDWGFRSDWIAPGIDARYTAARGLLVGPSDDQKHLYRFDPLQFSIDLWIPWLAEGTTVRVGRFVANGCVESIAAVNNFLSTHSYTYFYTPFTQTGLYATTKLSPQWYVTYGMVLGNDVFFDPTDEPTFIGGVKWVSQSKTDSVNANLYVNGGNYFGSRQRDNTQYFDLIYTHVWTPRFQTITEGMFSFQTAVPELNTVTWYSLVHYFQYDFTPRTYGAIRLEAWEDSQGQRTGFKGLYNEVTAGLTWKPRNWLFLRPEVRFDHNYGAAAPFDGKHSLFTLVQDVIVRW